MVSNLWLKTFNHTNTYPLGWVYHNTSLQVTKQCKLKFIICAKYIDEFLVDVIPLDMYGVILGNPNLWDRDGMYYQKLNNIRLVKYRKFFQVSVYKIHKKYNFGHYQSGKMPWKWL